MIINMAAPSSLWVGGSFHAFQIHELVVIPHCGKSCWISPVIPSLCGDSHWVSMQVIVFRKHGLECSPSGRVVQLIIISSLFAYCSLIGYAILHSTWVWCLHMVECEMAFIDDDELKPACSHTCNFLVNLR